MMNKLYNINYTLYKNRNTLLDAEVHLEYSCYINYTRVQNTNTLHVSTNTV